MHATEREILGCLDNRILQLILLPTEACNFRCVYCYEEFKYNRMQPDVVGGVLNLLSRRAPELNALHLSWFGGEPLLASDIIEKILRHVRELQQSYPQLILFSDITTNGYLLKAPLFKRLLDLNVSQYQISVDGAAERHDEKRVLANGRGTFEAIWTNLAAMSQAEGGFTVLVRVHVAKDNLNSIREFIEKFRETFRTDDRFKLFFRPLGRMGGPNDNVLPVFQENEGWQAVHSLSRIAEECGVAHITTNDITPICYAARGNSFVVRANGRLNKCTVALEHPWLC